MWRPDITWKICWNGRTMDLSMLPTRWPYSRWKNFWMTGQYWRSWIQTANIIILPTPIIWNRISAVILLWMMCPPTCCRRTDGMNGMTRTKFFRWMFLSTVIRRWTGKTLRSIRRRRKAMWNSAKMCLKRCRALLIIMMNIWIIRSIIAVRIQICGTVSRKP